MKVVLAALALTAVLAADSSYRTLGTASNPDWMSSLPDSAALSALSVPGTHETMSIRGGSLTQTQENLGDSGGAEPPQWLFCPGAETVVVAQSCIRLRIDD